MKWTKGRMADKETITYFIPRVSREVLITEDDWEKFFHRSEQGIEPKEKSPGYLSIEQGKRWRGVHMEMFEEGVISGDMPYAVILEDMPRPVVDFMKRELFKGLDANLIEENYLRLQNETI